MPILHFVCMSRFFTLDQRATFNPRQVLEGFDQKRTVMRMFLNIIFLKKFPQFKFSCGFSLDHDFIPDYGGGGES